MSDYLKKQLTLILGVIILLSAGIGCSDELSTIGTSILPNDDFFSSETDNSAILTASNQINPIESWDASSWIIGTLNDPVFGTTHSDFATTFTLGTIRDTSISNHGDSSYALKSVILNIPFSSVGLYGDTAATHRIIVYELSQKLPSGKLFSDLNINGYTYPEIVGDTILSARDLQFPVYADSAKTIVSYYKFNIGAKWAVKLKADFANKLYNMTEANTSSVNAFQDFFKGLYVTSELVTSPNNGIGTLIAASASSTTIDINYEHYKPNAVDATKNDTVNSIYSLYIGTQYPKLNRFTYESSPNITFNSTNTNQLYVQGLGGSYAKVNIGGDIFDTWKNKLYNKAINNGEKYGISAVELEVPADTTKRSNYFAMPSSLMLLCKDYKGDMVIPTFISKSDSAAIAYSSTYANQRTTIFSNSSFNTSTGIYSFKINNEYFQKYLLYLYNPQASGLVPSEVININELYIRHNLIPDQNFYRVVLNGPQSPESPMKLNIKYFIYK